MQKYYYSLYLSADLEVLAEYGVAPYQYWCEAEKILEVLVLVGFGSSLLLRISSWDANAYGEVVPDQRGIRTNYPVLPSIIEAWNGQAWYLVEDVNSRIVAAAPVKDLPTLEQLQLDGAQGGDL